jgi:hypothetical protein
VAPSAPETTVATVVPPELKVTVAPPTPEIVPEIEYVRAVAMKGETLTLAPLTVTVALLGEKL